MVVWIDPYRFASVAPFVFTDDFNRAASTNLGSNWSEADGLNVANFEISSNVLGVITGSGTAGFARCTVAIPSDDHYVQVEYDTSTAGSTSVVYVIGRVASVLGPGGSFYYGGWVKTAANVRTWRIGKFVAGTDSEIVTTPAPQPSNGDTIRLEIVGTSLVLKHNGTTVLSTTDASNASGSYAGIRMDGQDTGVDNFEIGTL